MRRGRRRRFRWSVLAGSTTAAAPPRQEPRGNQRRHQQRQRAQDDQQRGCWSTGLISWGRDTFPCRDPSTLAVRAPYSRGVRLVLRLVATGVRRLECAGERPWPGDPAGPQPVCGLETPDGALGDGAIVTIGGTGLVSGEGQSSLQRPGRAPSRLVGPPRLAPARRSRGSVLPASVSRRCRRRASCGRPETRGPNVGSAGRNGRRRDRARIRPREASLDHAHQRRTCALRYPLPGTPRTRAARRLPAPEFGGRDCPERGRARTSGSSLVCRQRGCGLSRRGDPAGMRRLSSSAAPGSQTRSRRPPPPRIGSPPNAGHVADVWGR